MAEPTTEDRLRSRKLASPLLLLLLALLLWILSAAAAAGAGIGLASIRFDNDVAAVGITYLIYAPATLLALFGLGALIAAAVRWGVFGRDGQRRAEAPETAQMLDLLRSINSRMLLSDTAKRIAYRQQDLQALRRTIEHDIDAGHHDAAMVLVSELAQTYGYREEAETYRERITAARAAKQEASISEATARVEDIIARHDFDRAAREAAKLRRLYPDSEQTKHIARRVAQARESYKQQLEREFLEAAEQEDVDRAMSILKEMDRYLTEEEAAPLRETARGVIGKRRDNLGVQFKMAVHNHQWIGAVRIGDQIIRDFPNTRMAEEVRGMIDLLRQRAAEQKAAQGQPASSETAS
ncbi:MAG: hypothetical protein ACOCTI_02725 [Phycisphaeraceae bacterium]